MDHQPTSSPGPLGRLRAWLRGDRYMVDSRPPAPVGAEPVTPEHDAPVPTAPRP